MSDLWGTRQILLPEVTKNFWSGALQGGGGGLGLVKFHSDLGGNRLFERFVSKKRTKSEIC